MPYKDPDKTRAYERERHRKRTAERLARGLCPRCGKHPPAAGRSVCEPCGERERAAERARYARGKAAGEPYGGRKPGSRRRAARERNRKRRRERREAGHCTHCGERPPAQGGVVCGTCREVWRAAERELYAARRAAGLCGRCGGPVFGGGSRCGPCAALDEGRDREKRNAARRGRYALLRAQGLCTDCGEPAQGTARCEPCAYRSYACSGEHRGCPSIRRDTPWSNSPRARNTDPGTAGRRSPCASPSPACHGRKSKSLPTHRRWRLSPRGGERRRPPLHVPPSSRPPGGWTTQPCCAAGGSTESGEPGVLSRPPGETLSRWSRPSRPAATRTPPHEPPPHHPGREAENDRPGGYRERAGQSRHQRRRYRTESRPHRPGCAAPTQPP